MFFKTESGWWFAGFYSNNFQDRQDEIITRAAHEDYSEWLKATGVRPPLVAMHQPVMPRMYHLLHYTLLHDGVITAEQYNNNLYQVYKDTMFAITEAVIPIQGFMLVLAKVLPGKEPLMKALMKDAVHWGMSHGFLIFDKSGSIINKYRSFELTLTPSLLAVNKVTPVVYSEGRIMEETLDVKTMTDKDRELIAEKLQIDPDTVVDVVERATELLRGGLASKSDEAVLPVVETPVEVAPVPVAVEYAAFREQFVKDLNVPELLSVLETLGTKMAQLEAELAQIKADTAELRKSDDVKVASFFTAPSWKSVIETSPVATDAKVVEDLKANITAESDAKKAEDNMLFKALWEPLGVKV